MQADARRNAERLGVLLLDPNGQWQSSVMTQCYQEILTKISVTYNRHQQQVHRVIGVDNVTRVERVACLLLEVKIHTLAWVPSK